MTVLWIVAVNVGEKHALHDALIFHSKLLFKIIACDLPTDFYSLVMLVI